MKTIKNQGITLIALVVTIIVLLILAGISIAMLTGENGILGRASEAKVESTHAEVKEAMRLEYADYILEKNRDGSTQTFIEYLQGRKIIPAETEEEGKYVISVEALVGGSLSLGNGTDGKDVYKLEEVTEEESTGKTNEVGKIASNVPMKIAVTDTTEGKEYKLMYYGKKDSENKEIDILSDVKEAKNDDIVLRVYAEEDGNIYHEFTVKSGTTWRQFVEASEYFEIHNVEFVRLSEKGKELFESISGGNRVIYNEENKPVGIDELINSEMKYIACYIGG